MGFTRDIGPGLIKQVGVQVFTANCNLVRTKERMKQEDQLW